MFKWFCMLSLWKRAHREDTLGAFSWKQTIDLMKGQKMIFPFQYGHVHGMSENFGAWISKILHVRQFDVKMNQHVSTD